MDARGNSSDAKYREPAPATSNKPHVRETGARLSQRDGRSRPRAHSGELPVPDAFGALKASKSASTGGPVSGWDNPEGLRGGTNVQTPY